MPATVLGIHQESVRSLPCLDLLSGGDQLELDVTRAWFFALPLILPTSAPLDQLPARNCDTAAQRQGRSHASTK